MPQGCLNGHYGRVRATEHAPCCFFCLLIRMYGFAEISERGGVAADERRRVIPRHNEHELIILAENALRHGYRFAQQ